MLRRFRLTRCRKFRNNASSLHYQDPVRHADQFGQFIGNENHANALFGQMADALVNLLLSAGVDAAGRIVEDKRNPSI